MAVTLQQLAAETGVDKATVSRILNGKGRSARISSERIDLVLRTAEMLNFRPNTAAKAVAEGRFNCITLVLSCGETTSTLPERLQLAIHDALGERDMHLMLSRLPDQKLTDEGFVPKILREYCSDGLLINYTDHIPTKLIDLIVGSRIPSIWLNTRQAADCIHPDDFQAGYHATRSLLARGHRRVAYADYSNGDLTIADAHYSARDRLDGYRHAMADAGLSPQIIRRERHVHPPHAEAFTRSWLEPEDRPEAVVAYSDRVALPVLVISRDLRLAQPVEVVCFGNEQVRLVSRAIPTMLVPQKRMGQEAVDMLLQKIQDPSAPLAPRPVPFDFVNESGELVATETVN